MRRPYLGAAGLIVNPASAMLLAELFLFGPRVLVRAIITLATVTRLGRRSIDEAADIVTKLVAVNRGVSMEDLGPGGPELHDAIVWLEYFGWIGVAERRDRVFLYSESVQRLV
jgi:hypothetical protein